MQIADAHCTVRFRQVAPVCHGLHILHPFFPQGRVCHHLKRQSSNDVLHASALSRHLQEKVHLSSNPGAVAGRVGIQGPVHEGVIIPQDARYVKANGIRREINIDLTMILICDSTLAASSLSLHCTVKAPALSP